MPVNAVILTCNNRFKHLKCALTIAYGIHIYIYSLISKQN